MTRPDANEKYLVGTMYLEITSMELGNQSHEVTYNFFGGICPQQGEEWSITLHYQVEEQVRKQGKSKEERKKQVSVVSWKPRVQKSFFKGILKNIK